MFEQARIKLAIFYAGMIMLVSLVFSFVIYKSVGFEFERGLRRVQVMRKVQDLDLDIPMPPPRRYEQQYPELFHQDLGDDLLENLNLAKTRFIGWLALINGIIFVCSIGLGYLVATITLDPIKKSHNQQKRFVADASHELKTPLAVMKTSIDVLQRNKKAKLADYKKLNDSLLEEVNNLHDLTNNLLSLSSSNISSLSKSKIDLQESLNQVIGKILPLAKSKRITIKKNLHSAKIWADEKSLKKLWMILLDNAIKYSKDQGTISISLESQKKSVIVTVSDDGIGIKEEELEKIFDRFYRVDSSRSKVNVPGYGLGLSMAKKITKIHGGDIKVESEWGSGSTFIVRLPIV